MSISYGGDYISDTDGGKLRPSSAVMRNRIINGAMVVSQRYGTSSVSIPSTATYTLDRYGTVASQSSKFSVQQNAGSVTPPAGFTNYLGITSSSAYSVPSNEIFCIYQNIEGFNTADLGWGTANAKPITISFWARSSLTGTFGGSIANENFDRSYPWSYTISAANTWEYKTVTIAGDTSGTWTGATNGIGMRVYFPIGVGADYSGTAGAWTGSGKVSATGAVSVVGTSGATLYITGIQLEKGSVATDFEYRQYGTEEMLCKRYYAKMNSTSSTGACGAGVARSSTASNVFIKLPVTMRSIPTVSYSSVYLNYNSDVYQAVTSNSGVQGGTDSINYFPNASSAGMSTGYVVLLAIGSGGYVDFNSEL